MSNHEFQHAIAKGRPGHHLGYPQSHKLNPYLLQWWIVQRIRLWRHMLEQQTF